MNVIFTVLHICRVFSQVIVFTGFQPYLVKTWHFQAAFRKQNLSKKVIVMDQWFELKNLPRAWTQPAAFLCVLLTCIWQVVSLQRSWGFCAVLYFSFKEVAAFSHWDDELQRSTKSSLKSATLSFSEGALGSLRWDAGQESWVTGVC